MKTLITRIILTDGSGITRLNIPLKESTPYNEVLRELEKSGRLISPSVDSFGVLLAGFSLRRS